MLQLSSMNKFAMGKTLNRRMVTCKSNHPINDESFIEDHKSNMRELRKILLEKRKELERKRVAQFHQLRDSIKKNSSTVNELTANLQKSVSVFAEAEVEFLKSIFPNHCNGCGHESDVNESKESAETVEPEVMDSLDAKMDPSYEPPKST